MSEDKSDKKLPVPYHKTETTPTAVDRVHSPVSNQTLLGRFASGFVARLNRHTIERNIEEVRAHTEYAKARGEYADICTEAERKIEHYLKHRNDIIADDHEQYLEQREANRIERADAREEREHQRLLARERRQQELNQARFASATTRFGLEAFNQSLPYRQEQLEHTAKTGTLDAELDMLMRVKDVAEKRKPENTPKAQPPQTDALELVLAELDHEIEVAHRTQASDDVKSELYALRSRISALIEKEKNQSR